MRKCDRAQKSKELDEQINYKSMNTEKHYHMERKCEAIKYLTLLNKDVFVCVIIIII